MELNVAKVQLWIVELSKLAGAIPKEFNAMLTVLPGLTLLSRVRAPLELIVSYPVPAAPAAFVIFHL